MLILEIVKGKDRAHKDAFKIENSTLKREDRSKVIKLLSKIREKENIAEKLEKPSYNTQTILKTKITFEYPDEGIEQTFTLLHHAIRHENSQAVKDILEKAEEQSLLEEVLNQKMIVKCRDGQKVICSIKKEEILKILKREAINLKDVLHETKVMEYQRSIEEMHAMLVDAISRKDDSTVRAILTVLKSTGILKVLLNKMVPIKHKNSQEVTCTLLDYAKLCKNSEAEDEILKVARDERILENFGDIFDENPNEQLPNAAKETDMKELKDSYTLEEALEECKESLDIEEQTNANKATKTGTQLCKNVNEDSDNLNILQPTCETSEKAQNSSTERPNATDSSSLAVYFDGNATDKKDNPSTKTTQQRRAILAGFIGTALLAASVALCILEMYVVAVVCGIVGLVCMGFVLYNAINPNTKLEKMKDIEQLTAQPLLNPAN